MLIVETKSAEETQKLAERLAGHLFPNAVIRLEGDLGAGKTTFTKGLARGLGIDRVIKSPTYTLIREYEQEPLSLYHMDLYRLEDSNLDGTGVTEYFNYGGVVVIEWGSMVDQADLPQDYLLVELAGSGDEREIRLTGHGSVYADLVKKMEQGS